MTKKTDIPENSSSDSDNDSETDSDASSYTSIDNDFSNWQYKYKKGENELIRTLTMNFNDKKQFIDNCLRVNMVSQYYQSYLLKYLKPYANYDCYLEYSRPENWIGGDKISRIHIHGIIQFHTNESMMAFYVESAHKLFKEATSEIDTCADVDKWIKYITKENYLVKHYCELNNCNWYFNNYDKITKIYTSLFPSKEEKDNCNNIIQKLKNIKI